MNLGLPVWIRVDGEKSHTATVEPILHACKVEWIGNGKVGEEQGKRVFQADDGGERTPKSDSAIRMDTVQSTQSSWQGWWDDNRVEEQQWLHMSYGSSNGQRGDDGNAVNPNADHPQAMGMEMHSKQNALGNNHENGKPQANQREDQRKNIDG